MNVRLEPMVGGGGGRQAVVRQVLDGGDLLAQDLAGKSVKTAAYAAEAGRLRAELAKGPTPDEIKRLYYRARAAVRKLAWRKPLLDIERLLIAKRVPGSYSHQSDQYLGWWFRPGGGIYILENPFGEEQELKHLTAEGLVLVKLKHGQTVVRLEVGQP